MSRTADAREATEAGTGVRTPAATSSLPALFSYAVTPTVVPCSDDPGKPATVALMIALNNATGDNQPCDRLVFTLPVGEGAGDLTADPNKVTPSAAAGTPWTITSDGAGTFTAVPLLSVTGLQAGASIAFILDDVPVNTLPGLAGITIYEGTAPMRQTQVGVSKVPPGLAITRFTASPIQVAPGAPSTLEWTTTGADSCQLSWRDGGGPVPAAGSQPVRPQDTTVYTLSVTGGGTTISQQVTIVVPHVEILSFGAEPAEVPQGGPSTLSWEVVNADTCFIEPGHLEVDPGSGSHVVTPDATETYFLIATGYGKSASEPQVVDVMPVAIPNFAATPSQLTIGQSALLQWQSRWSTGTAIDQGVGTVPAAGATEVTPQNNTTYTLTAQGSAGPVTAAATVSVASVAVTSFTVDPSTTDPGGMATLTWTTEWASSCDINGQSVPTAGTLQVNPQRPATYTLTAQGPNGPATASVVLNVNAVEITSFDTWCVDDPGICMWQNATYEFAWETVRATSVQFLLADTGQVLSTAPSGSFSQPGVTYAGFQPQTFRVLAQGPGGPTQQDIVLVYHD